MSSNSNFHFSRWLYKTGAGILFILAVIAIVAFIKALSIKEYKNDTSTISYADSAQVVVLKKDVQELNRKVDSLIVLTPKEPQKVYRYLKPKKDSCTIEVNIHNK